jgi:hypothetical protein
MDTKTPEVLAEEKRLLAIEEKRAALELKHNSKVHYFEFVVSRKDNDIAGMFILKPTRFAKMQVLDLSAQSVTRAGQLLLDTCALKEESDPRFFDEKEENEELWLGLSLIHI